MKKILLLALSLFSLQALSLDFVYTKHSFWGVGSEGNEFAIEGYDAVNYFTENQPAKGNSKFSFKYQGKTWHFKNAENLALFKTDPQRYAPQYGGHCAWRMSIDGEGVYGDPNIWTIVDNKLYLNYNKETNSRWIKDIPGFISKANDFWLGKNKFTTLN
ncbi:MAG: YHS domain-containing protein [Gammaproteobacteria bacterium]|uniref:YHS domain-containing protein n=1 Tax=endosymbiont of Bathymodiolus septemdierum str. Myojin knoll TaxID=1303921 RepID=A0A0P0UR23_9GAMM|nr:YHS domain-containing (seleno)protein [Bathymodiolus septemdierum thioautotrophic gill symbiont]RUA05338.1 MAG: YHS domain-containing protein [Gammaproteobacteria bacterium]BAS67483.1 conserved hypothetical protein [endosymbiont of Bathymodiolus septemdierum str. Myojin knoll]